MDLDENFDVFQDHEDDDQVEETAPVAKFQGRVKRQIWTLVQEFASCKAWVHISDDKKVENQQTRDGFWSRVHKHYNALIGGSSRTTHQLNSNWGPLNTQMNWFNKSYI